MDFANSQQLDPRVTFSRSTTAPYYDGKTSVLAEQNLVIYSQLIGGTGWTYSGANLTVSTNAVTAPDGTTTASTLTATGTSAQHTINLITSTPVSPTYQTLSVYVQAGTNNFVQLLYGVDGNAYANFNLSTGVVGTVGSSATATITQVGSSTWYRCSVTTQSATAAGFFFLICTSATASRYESNTLTTSINIWGAQLEQRSSVTAYNATTTSALTNYIPQLLSAPINAPRFDFNPTTGESLGLLIEQSSTNLLTYSQDFSNAVWTKTNSTITTGANIAPDGTQTAQLLVESTSNSSHGFYATAGFSQTNAQSYTQTIYAKAKERAWVVLQPTSSNPNAIAYFNLATGVIGTLTNCSATITPAGNGWYRCQATYVAIATAVVNYSGVFLATGDGGASYTGNGYSGIYVWASQFEALAFPTSYIPTTSAQVTRAADVAQMTGTNFSSWYNQSQGTFLVDYVANQSLPTTVVAGIFGCGPGAYAVTNSINLFLGNSQIAAYYSPNGYPELNLYVSIKPLIAKISMSYSATIGALAVNGSTTTSQTGNFPNNGGINSIQFGVRYYNDNSTFLNGWIKKFAHYPQLIPLAQQQSLTGS